MVLTMKKYNNNDKDIGNYMQSRHKEIETAINQKQYYHNNDNSSNNKSNDNRYEDDSYKNNMLDNSDSDGDNKYHYKYKQQMQQCVEAAVKENKTINQK
jgi:hypothetical protein